MKNKILKNETLKTFLLYTGIFTIIFLFIISIFNSYGKEFVFNADGIRQHIINLQYYRSLIVNLIRTGSISAFTWNIAGGIDLFSNFAYYILGDFFSYIAIFFPTKSIESLYSILMIVRIYFIGISFLCYCKYKKMDTTPSLIGALMYTFSTYVLYASIRHPYFSNAIMLFPLLMIGIEKIIKEDKFIFYTIIIAVLYISNFYFAYMLSLVIAIYGIVLAIYTYKKDGTKKIIQVLLKTLFFSIIGVLISAVVLLPTGIDFINSERVGTNIIYPYSINYYRNFIPSLLTVDESAYWKFWSVQSIVLISLTWIIKNRKENYPIFITMLILLVPLLISQIGSIFCGFSYPNNRWTFVMTFIFAFLTTEFFNKNPKIDNKFLQNIIICFILFLGIQIFFKINMDFYTVIELFILLIILLVMINREKIQNITKKLDLYNISLISLIVLGIFSSIKFIYSPNGNNYASSFLDQKTYNKSLNTSLNTIPDFNKSIKYINEKDTDFYKISKYPYNYENVSLIKKFNSLGHYYSITPELKGDLNIDLLNKDYNLSTGSKEFDYRTKITSLLGVKYLINGNNNNRVPYGYTEEDYQGKSKIYINNYSLPFGVLYTNYITEREYETLSPLEKESSLLKTTVLENTTNLNKFSGYNYNNTIKEIDFNIIDKNKILKSNEINITKLSHNKIKLNVKNIKNSELYIYFENMNYKPFDKNELPIKNKTTKINIAKQKENNRWLQPNYAYLLSVNYNNITKARSIRDKLTSPYYMDINDFLFNLGYYDETSGDITITLNKTGHYTFDNIRVYAVSFEDYEEDINNLRKSNFKTEEYSNGYLKGTVNPTESGVLQFSTTYNKGFKVYVDGKETKTFTSNKYFLGIEIEKGQHEIILKYHNPYTKYGLIITVFGITSLTICIILNKRKNI